jgi:hypothetical protein
MEQYMEQSQETRIVPEQNKSFSRRSLKYLRLQLSEAIFELAGLNRVAVDADYTNLLWQTYAAAKVEINRKLTNDAGSDEYFEKLTTARLVAFHLGGRLLEHLDEKKKNEESRSSEERNAVGLLNVVLALFDDGCEELSALFPPFNDDQLPKKLYFGYFNVTVGQAYNLAEQITDRLR